jgi:hypothetical protein
LPSLRGRILRGDEHEGDRVARMKGVALFTGLLIASCGSVQDKPDAAPDADPAAPVIVTITQHWINERGEISGTQDVTDTAPDVAAWIPAPNEMGGFVKRASEKTAAGLAIPDIPPGTTFYLDASSPDLHLMFVTDERELDVKLYSIARRDAVQTTTATNLTLNVANMTAWQDGDTLELYCANVEAFGGLDARTPHVRGWPAAGARQLAVTLDWAQVDRGFFGSRPTPLIDGTKGDSLLISHVRQIGSSNQYPYNAVLATATFGAFTQVDGGSLTLDAAFPATAPVKDAVHFVVRRPDFERHARDIHPDATPTPGFTGGLRIRAQPNDPRHERQVTAAAPSMVFTLFGADTTNLDMGQMVYPRPPAGWSQWIDADHNFRIVRDTPFGIKHTVVVPIRMAAKLTPATAPADVITPIVPRVSPPRSPMINGASFHAAQTLDLQPTRAPISVTWNAPTLIDSAPTIYALRIYRVTRTGEELTDTLVAAIHQPATGRSVAIPWNVFPGVGYYYFVLTAGAEIGEVDARFDDLGRTDSTADTVSGILTLQ